MDRWMDGGTGGCIDRQMDRYMDRQTIGNIDRLRGGWMTGKWMDSSIEA